METFMSQYEFLRFYYHNKLLSNFSHRVFNAKSVDIEKYASHPLRLFSFLNFFYFPTIYSDIYRQESNL